MQVYFNPLPPHGGRLEHLLRRNRQSLISIHSLRMEGDPLVSAEFTRMQNFNPLPPHGGRLSLRTRLYKLPYFNPLPPHGGRLKAIPQIILELWNFNPLPPHGGRHWYSYAMSEAEAFQSTPSAWRETECYVLLLATHINFNPLPPHGGRLQVLPLQCDTRRISIHSLRMEGDRHWKKS